MTSRNNRLIDPKTIDNLLKANNIIALLALCSMNGWFVFFSMLFWAFTLFVLIRRDIHQRSISIATIVYILLLLAILALCLFVLF